MITRNEILETNQMIDNANLDVRTCLLYTSSNGENLWTLQYPQGTSATFWLVGMQRRWVCLQVILSAHPMTTKCCMISSIPAFMTETAPSM